MSTKKILNRVTVTGADDSTNLEDLQRLGEKYRFAEFGILLSRSNMLPTPQRSVGRFPSIEFLKELSKVFYRSSFQFSAHLCGSWVREFLMGETPFEELKGLVDPNIWKVFNRIQVNTHGQPHKYLADTLISTVDSLKTHQIIWQYDKVNYELLATTLFAGCRNISTLFDLSHGTGVLPQRWPLQIMGVYCGYAGGLSPENVGPQLTRIAHFIDENQPIWIDTETHLRSHYYNNDSGDQGFTVDYFDLKKVEAFLEACVPFVKEKFL